MRGGMMQSFTRRIVLGGLAALAIGAAPAPSAPLVLAAASLQESLTAAADAWAKAGHPQPIVSFAASSTLARQVEAGAPADLFVSADEEWMDALAAKGLLAAGTRADLVGNRLVVVEPAGRHSVIPTSGRRLARVLGAGPLAMADPDSVPAGKYGKAALEKLGAWDAVAPSVVRAENVRAALSLVERGAAPFGIVYLTDAKASTKVRVAGVFPRASHPPILYPVARLARSANPEAEGFRRFLLSPRGRSSPASASRHPRGDYPTSSCRARPGIRRAAGDAAGGSADPGTGPG
jgi:molybdate transport system substrate-binding protein